MLPAQAPFPCYWWGTGLEAVGLRELRPDRGTYGRYDFHRLPPLPFALSGDFAWLATAPAHPDHIGVEHGAEIPGALQLLRASAQRLRLPLPGAFTKFLETPSLQQRIRSTTDCYLDLCPEPIRSPKGGGWLIHFLADSQGCLFWYVYLTKDGSDHAVVTAPDLSAPSWSGRAVVRRTVRRRSRTHRPSRSVRRRSRSSSPATGWRMRCGSRRGARRRCRKRGLRTSSDTRMARTGGDEAASRTSL